MPTIEYSDRYSGMTAPDPSTICKGECEGIGRVPVFMAREIEIAPGDCVPETETDFHLVTAWRQAEAQKHSVDGWQLVVCPTCKGSGIGASS